MSVIRLKALGIAACVMLSLPSEALAWGPDGHRIVCRIATQLLDASYQKVVTALTNAFRTPDGGRVQFFTDGCVFADDARTRARGKVPGWERFAPFETWHFLNVPRTTHLVSESHCQGACILTGIAHHAGALASGTTDAARGEALFFLGHWVGDVHQPLHISFADDRGGNDIAPINGGFYSSGNLHALWDSGIIARAVGQGGWRAYADRLAREITPAERAVWTATPALAWAQEAYILATRPRTQYCTWRTVKDQSSCVRITGVRTLGQAYQDELADDVAMRLQQAGARLADLLRRHLMAP